MNYYYDIDVCLQKENIMFYEWLSKEYIKKIRTIRVSDQTIKDIMSNDIKVSNKLLDELRNNNYLCLFVANIGSVVIEFNKKGISKKRSYLQVQDEVNIQDILYTFKEEQIEYELVKKKKYKEYLLREEVMKMVIQDEIYKLVKSKNYMKLEYLYYEWFNKEAKEKKVLVNDMLSKLNKGIGKQEENIYNIIKNSINN